MKPSTKDQIEGKLRESHRHRQPECKAGHSAAQKPSRTAMVILRAIAAGPVYIYGFKLIEMTGLPSGTVYPVMRRLERDGLIQSHWERRSIADAEQRPLRNYYKLTSFGWQRLSVFKSLPTSQDEREKQPAMLDPVSTVPSIRPLIT
jgi:PadR family transcriptional regulator PadR